MSFVAILKYQKAGFTRQTYSKKIPHYKLGNRTLRFEPKQIEAWLEDNNQKLN